MFGWVLSTSLLASYITQPAISVSHVNFEQVNGDCEAYSEAYLRHWQTSMMELFCKNR